MGRWDDSKEPKTLHEFKRNCDSYSVVNERYEPAHYKDAGGNGSFMGLEGIYLCDAVIYDGGGKKVGDAKDLTDTYGIRMSPVQFYQTARQIMAFCNKEFGTKYDTTFKTPEWVRPTFCDVTKDYNRKGFPEYLDMKYPIDIKPYAKEMWNNPNWVHREPLYSMRESRWGGVSWGEKPKSYFIGLAEGFNDYVRNAKDMPKGMYDHYNLFLMKDTEERFGLKPKYTLNDILNILKARIGESSAKAFTPEQKAVIRDFYFSSVTKYDIGKAHLDSFAKEFQKMDVPKEWISDARSEFLDILNEEEMKMRERIFHFHQQPSEEVHSGLSR